MMNSGGGMHSFNSLFLLQEQGGQASPFNFLFLIGGMLLIMYFVMFRPQMKEQKRRKEMLASVKKHDQVLTSGGVYGVVVSVGESDVVLKVDDNVRIKFARSAITAIISRDKDEEAAS
jgi:preprotein translocase subunit YajC